MPFVTYLYSLTTYPSKLPITQSTPKTLLKTGTLKVIDNQATRILTYFVIDYY
ncbi:MAG: hypothetical protein ACHQFX_16930 [Chitinophagales bacterium]